MKFLFFQVLTFLLSAHLFAGVTPKNKALSCSSLLKSHITLGLEEETSHAHEVFRSFLRDILKENETNIAQIIPGIDKVKASSEVFSQKSYSAMASRVYGIERSFHKPGEFLKDGKNYGVVLKGKERIIKHLEGIIQLRNELKISNKKTLEGNNIINGFYGTVALANIFFNIIRPFFFTHEINSDFFSAYFTLTTNVAFFYSIFNYIEYSSDSVIEKLLETVIQDQDISWLYQSIDYKNINKSLIENVNNATFEQEVKQQVGSLNASNTPYVQRMSIPSTPQRFSKNKTGVYIDYLLQKVDGEFQLTTFLRTSTKKPVFKNPEKEKVKESIFELLKKKVLQPSPVRGT